MYNIDELMPVNIGLTGTNKQQTVEIDVTSWREKWADAVFTLYVVRPTETAEDAYPADAVVDGNVLRWTVRTVDVAFAGEGTFEIHATEVGTDALYAKSKPTRFRVMQSAVTTGGEVPEVAEQWTQRVEQAAASAAESASSATGSAEAAAESERVARELLEHLPEKVDKYQGTQFHGKVLGIDENGYVTPVAGGGGGGSVESVNNVLPDENGNVQLTPENIGAASTQALANEAERATQAESGLSNAIEAEKQRAQAAEQALAGNLSAEQVRAQAAEQANAAAIAAQSETIATHTEQLGGLKFEVVDGILTIEYEVED